MRARAAPLFLFFSGVGRWVLNVLCFFPSIYALEVFGEIPEPQFLSFLFIVFYRTERLATIFVFIPQGTNFSIVIAVL